MLLYITSVFLRMHSSCLACSLVLPNYKALLDLDQYRRTHRSLPDLIMVRHTT